ncbi:MAG: hypothetical protein K5868_09500 [Lachnospiraceae bacterium]|nr:hypothetical protein [Lachnospiraceae bacterium]
MDDNNIDFNSISYDLSNILEPIDKGRQSIIEMINNTLEQYRMVVKPILDLFVPIHETIIGAVRNMGEAFKPISVARMLGEHQYIQWERMPESFVEDIYNSSNIDKTLRLMYEREKYKSFYTVANSCIESGILGRNDRIIHQAVNSFANKDYDLASIGITVVLDGTLSRITGNVTTNIKSRVNQLLQQLNEDEELTNEEYALLTLYISLDNALGTFAASLPFDGIEPSCINRHWMVHGRSSRRRTKMDCVKLIRFLYAVIIINEIENK